MAISFKHFKEILEDILSYIIGHSDISDVNPGSNIRTISEAVSIEIATLYVQLRSALSLFSLDKAFGSDLDDRAEDFGASRTQPTTSTGTVTITDSTAVVADSTLKAAITTAATSLAVQDADFSSFPASGSVVIDRGNSLRELVAYSSKTSPDTLNLTATPTSNHAAGAVVYLSTQGADVLISSGLVVKTGTPEVLFETTSDGTLLDGDASVTIPIESQETGSATVVQVGKITIFDSAPFTGATVTNEVATSGGQDLETDAALRERIREEQQAFSSSTAYKIETEARAVTYTNPSTGVTQQVIEAALIEPVITPDEMLLYINDGTDSFAVSVASIEETEVCISDAEPAQRRGQLDLWPIVSNSEQLFVSLERGEATSVGTNYLADTTQAWAPSSSAATGSITTIAGASLIDGETFTLDDGVAAVTFEFDNDGSVSGSNTPVAFTSLDTADVVRNNIIQAVNDLLDGFRITASNGGAGTVSLVNDRHGVLGNTTSSDTVAAGGFVVTNMTGGVDGAFQGYKLKDENDDIFDVFGNTATTIITDGDPALGTYALFDPSATVLGSGGSKLVKNTDYVINDTNGNFELTAASFPSGLTAHDTVIAFYNGSTAAYQYKTGLVREVQRTINGDPNDLDTYPGVKAAGTKVDVRVPTMVNFLVDVSITAVDGVDETVLYDDVKSAIVTYVNALGIGDNAILSKMVEAALSVGDVADAVINSPASNQIMTESQIAKIALADVTVS